MTVSEQALVDLLAFWAERPPEHSHMALAALRAALGPDTILTSEGLARVEQWADPECETCEGKGTNWDTANDCPLDCPDCSPLYTFIPVGLGDA